MSAADAGQAQRSAMSPSRRNAPPLLACAATWSPSTRAKFTTSTSTRSTPTCGWCSRPNSTWRSLAAIPTTSTYPRYDLDITFFRVYENDKPAHLDNYLRWSTTGVKDNDLIFVSGHPGGTDRLMTMASSNSCAMWISRRASPPISCASHDLQAFSAQSPENARIAQEDIFGFRTSQKAITGYLEGCATQPLMRKRSRRRSSSAKRRSQSDPKMRAEMRSLGRDRRSRRSQPRDLQISAATWSA